MQIIVNLERERQLKSVAENLKQVLIEEFKIDEATYHYVENMEKKIDLIVKEIELKAELHQYRVIKAMQRQQLSERHFAVSTGYGYDDVGRETLEKIYADVFYGEDALVRPHISSGTHAISLALFGVLRPGDTLLSISGKPYDTIETVIGSSGKHDGHGTLKDYGINYQQIELTAKGQFDERAILKAITDDIKMVYIQRSTGYSWRGAIALKQMKEMIEKIRTIRKDLVVFVDNCYGEFIDSLEPTAIGADLMAGSLIKNPGGGLAPTGGYVVGRKDLVHLAACRLSAPGVARETGATLGINRILLQGLFLAPTVVGQALKSAIMVASIYKSLGFEVCPDIKAYRSDIIQSVKLNNPEAVKIFCRAIQEAAPVDSFLTPEAWEMPGYEDPIIMAAGAFIQGSSIELSADAPMREPYIVYFQGGLTYYHGKLGLMLTLQGLINKNIIKI